MENSKKQGSIIVWILLLVGLVVALWLAFKSSDPSPGQASTSIQEPPPEYPVEVHDGPEYEGQNKASTYIPQHSEDNPKMESVDPFTTHRDFEVFLSARNKKDFDFDFGNEAGVSNYKLHNGGIDFKLVGTLKTTTELENNVSLKLELYKNDQISFTKRKAFQSFDFPFIKETERKSTSDKLLYSFEINEKLESLEPGLYYFLIVPFGRNRVLYGEKFIVR